MSFYYNITVSVLFPWQKIEKVETEIENLLYTFDAEMEEKQVPFQTNVPLPSAKDNWKNICFFYLDKSSCACEAIKGVKHAVWS